MGEWVWNPEICACVCTHVLVNESPQSEWNQSPERCRPSKAQLHRHLRAVEVKMTKIVQIIPHTGSWESEAVTQNLLHRSSQPGYLQLNGTPFCAGCSSWLSTRIIISPRYSRHAFFVLLLVDIDRVFFSNILAEQKVVMIRLGFIASRQVDDSPTSRDWLISPTGGVLLCLQIKPV